MKKIRNFLKQFYWIRFFNLYLKQLYLKTFYSSTKAKENYIKKQFKKHLGYEIDFNKSLKHLIKRYNLESYMIIILCIQFVQINIE